jgi:hypothetical protein
MHLSVILLLHDVDLYQNQIPQACLLYAIELLPKPGSV